MWNFILGGRRAAASSPSTCRTLAFISLLRKALVSRILPFKYGRCRLFNVSTVDGRWFLFGNGGGDWSSELPFGEETVEGTLFLRGKEVDKGLTGEFEGGGECCKKETVKHC
jgi:hypothetical protein